MVAQVEAHSGNKARKSLANNDRPAELIFTVVVVQAFVTGMHPSRRDQALFGGLPHLAALTPHPRANFPRPRAYSQSPEESLGTFLLSPAAVLGGRRETKACLVE